MTIRVLRSLFRVVTGCLSLIVVWSIAYFVILEIYKYTGTPHSLFIQQLVTSMAGIFILVLVIGTAGLLGRGRRRRMDMWTSMIDVLGQIAQGNFNAKLFVNDKHAHDLDHPFSQLVNSVNNMAEQLQRMEQMRQEFVSNVSHEIQSPLTSINGFAKALRSTALSVEEREHYLDIIEAESQRLSKLSDNLLKLTSLESEHHPFELRTYRLDKQLRSIILAAEPQWRAKHMELDVDLVDVSIQADEELLSQVWVNLLNNSIKFTPNRGTVRIRLQQDEQSALVCFSDTGPGIAPGEKERIFERFYKVDKSRNRAIGGSGLGLSIVQKIVQLHHGTIEVESEVGNGAQFSIRLPLKYV